MRDQAFTQLLARATWHAEETVIRPIAFTLILTLDGRESLSRIVKLEEALAAG